MTSTTVRRDHGSSVLTEGIRVSARPQFLAGQSRTDLGKYLFIYHMTIRNESAEPARLVRRHWFVVDAEGETHEVSGEGAVGQTPRIEPGQEWQYASYCPLGTPWGTMEGWYEMQRDDGSKFRVTVGRFFLVSDDREG
ncbi:MAG TPA: Co2+/Mg2+ efflux protein ApaG [Phycisphaerales bacterium]|nr:Co2+/Mg2+ efflux protein ApaG [Phycisphaerales bacterium]HMP38046.1 Co2+/Mg2+ efflux protein ApaG [Phycisphaerales bacterium]